LEFSFGRRLVVALRAGVGPASSRRHKGSRSARAAAAAARLRMKRHSVYLGPDGTFPPPEYAKPGGYVLRITPERLGGSGPWAR
jgi:hypothetical protein